MSSCETIREFFRHNDWGRDRILALADPLDDAQLDREFEMGRGSLRQTIIHLWGAERYWLNCWLAPHNPAEIDPVSPAGIADLRALFRATAAERERFLSSLSDDDLRSEVVVRHSTGDEDTLVLADMMLHVCNHGAHHRAQALNMLRHLGVAVPNLGYLFMKVEHPTVRFEPESAGKLREGGLTVGEEPLPPVDFDPALLSRGLAYGDWASKRIVASAGKLDDQRLDQPFEMGLGTLRKTLLHIVDAESWWVDNWTGAAQPEWEKTAETTAIGELVSTFAEVRRRRDSHLSGISPDALLRVVPVWATPELKLHFRLGESVVQLIDHGTNHRAQAVNMLRHLGAPVPSLDFDDWLEELDR